jgi:hypothetical protein
MDQNECTYPLKQVSFMKKAKGSFGSHHLGLESKRFYISEWRE